jgi:hypothetical protein
VVRGRVAGSKRVKINLNPWIVDVIFIGLRLEFYSMPTPEIIPNNSVLGPTQLAICNEEVEDISLERRYGLRKKVLC